MMIHPRASVEEVSGQAPNLLHVDIRRRRDGMNAEARIALLQFHKGIIRLHRSVEGARRHSKPIVKLSHAIERQLNSEQVEPLLLQSLGDLLHCPLRKVPVRRNIDLAYFVLTDELTANLPKFRPNE